MYHHIYQMIYTEILSLTLTIDAKDVCQRFTTDFNKCVLQKYVAITVREFFASLETIFIVIII